MYSHYTFQIRTFWLSIGLFLVGAAIAFWGGIFSLILVGLPFLWLGLTICGLTWAWFLVRSILGVIFSSSLFPGRAPKGHVALTVFVGGALQPDQVVARCKQTSVGGTNGLVNAVAVEEAAVEDRDLRLFGEANRAIDVYAYGHGRPAP